MTVSLMLLLEYRPEKQLKRGVLLQKMTIFRLRPGSLFANKTLKTFPHGNKYAGLASYNGYIYNAIAIKRIQY